MTSSPPSLATEAAICPLLKTGREGCSARFDRSLYQLELSEEGGNKKTVDLGFSGSRVLERLLQCPGEVVSREELMSYAWENRVVGQGSLSQQIYTLRQILFDGHNQIIQTLPRRGYLFNPQYLHDAESPIVLAPVAPVEKRTVVVELPTPSARPPNSPTLPARPRSAGRMTLLAGMALLLLIGLGILGMRLTDPSLEPSLTYKQQIGKLEVLYIESNQRLLDSLVAETGTAVELLSAMTDEPARLIINLSPGFYEIHCLHADGVNWLKVHKDQIRTIATEHLYGCMR